jgi:hypothetical protein
LSSYPRLPRVLHAALHMNILTPTAISAPLYANDVRTLRSFAMNLAN